MSELNLVTDPVMEVWPRVVEAFAYYGKKVRARPGSMRRGLIQTHIDDGFEPDDFAAAVHGYLHVHKGFDTEFSNGGTSGDYFRPETVFKQEGFEDRVERGYAGPWRTFEKRSERREREARELRERERNQVLREREAANRR